MRWRSTVQPAFVAASVVWAALLLLAPWAAGRPHATNAGAALVVAVYGIGSLLCHQLPERSYRVWSAQMPVCARCAGIYFGAAIAALVASAPLRRPGSGRRGPAAPGPAHGVHPLSGAANVPAGPRVALAIAALPSLATLLYEWISGHTPSHAIRAAAGVPMGAVASWLVARHADTGRKRTSIDSSTRPEPPERSRATTSSG